MCWILFLIKILQRKCFPVNFAKLLKNLFHRTPPSYFFSLSSICVLDQYLPIRLYYSTNTRLEVFSKRAVQEKSAKFTGK